MSINARRAAVLALVCASACNCPGGASSSSAQAVEVTASRAVLHWQQQRLRVTGTARPEEGIDHRWEAPGSGAWFHLVPVVDESWEEGDPVPLWITTASGRDDAASWKAALTAALQRGPIEVEIVAKAGLDPRERPTGWHAALEALAAADGLSTDANAPIAMWPLP